MLFAYLDHSLGQFITSFRQTPAWKNTLIVILPDHGVTWPADINELILENIIFLSFGREELCATVE